MTNVPKRVQLRRTLTTGLAATGVLPGELQANLTDRELYLGDASGNGLPLLNIGALNIKTRGVRGDGTGDEQAAIQAAWNYCAAAGIPCYMPAGVYMSSSLTPLNGLVCFSNSSALCIIRRPATSTSTEVLASNSNNGFRFADITFDANKGANANAARAVGVYQGYDFRFVRCRAINGKQTSGAGLGGGFQIVSTVDGAHFTRSAMIECEAVNNDDAGLFVGESNYFSVVGGEYSRNTSGILFVDFAHPQVANTEKCNRIEGVIANYNTGVGIGCGSIDDLGNFIPLNGSAQDITIAGNIIRGNGSYGLVYAGGGGVIVGNQIIENGSTASVAGALIDGEYITFTGNLARGNAIGGVDGGGATFSIFDDNIITQNAWCGLNLGAATGSAARGNLFSENIGSHLNIAGVDGASGTDLFRDNSAWCVAESNQFVLAGTTPGITLPDGPSAVVVRDNNFIAPSPSYCLTGIYISPTDISGNRVFGGIDGYAAATTVTIADINDRITLSGSGSVATIRYASQAATAGTVAFATVTSQGSGYTANRQYALVFTGGGGSGAAGVAQTNTAGQICVAQITSHGTGYTSAPTISVATPGSGAVIVATVGTAAAMDGRELLVVVPPGVTLGHATGNMALVGAANIAGPRVVRLLGMYGAWQMIG